MTTQDEHLALTGVRWRKSTRSNEMGGACVEVTAACSMVALRDSKNPDGPKLFVPPSGWQGLLGVIKSGAYDLGPRS